MLVVWVSGLWSHCWALFTRLWSRLSTSHTPLWPVIRLVDLSLEGRLCGSLLQFASRLHLTDSCPSRLSIGFIRQCILRCAQKFVRNQAVSVSIWLLSKEVFSTCQTASPTPQWFASTSHALIHFEQLIAYTRVRSSTFPISSLPPPNLEFEHQTPPFVVFSRRVTAVIPKPFASR